MDVRGISDALPELQSDAHAHRCYTGMVRPLAMLRMLSSVHLERWVFGARKNAESQSDQKGEKRMTQEEIYELLHSVLEPFNRGLDLERKFALDGLLDIASRKLAVSIETEEEDVQV